VVAKLLLFKRFVLQCIGMWKWLMGMVTFTFR